jgi:hypothetical protein
MLDFFKFALQSPTDYILMTIFLILALENIVKLIKFLIK